MPDSDQTRHDAVAALLFAIEGSAANRDIQSKIALAQAAVDAIAVHAHVLATSKPTHDLQPIFRGIERNRIRQSIRDNLSPAGLAHWETIDQAQIDKYVHQALNQSLLYALRDIEASVPAPE